MPRHRRQGQLNAADDSADQPDAHANDPDWPNILIAHDMPDPAVAILRYDDYRRRNPGKNADAQAV